ncbi:hypothetical protein JIQ42_04817 [Leishmania sp. Namibia]|uniref:hypothetical protein n=1 Tax=Leishmania sp. Namibia TaxID=2802991 RepID=UPI001B667C1E|nr:hypothetical protein JIQ42_04817 [Leishmania sp. Namibia]
MFTSAVDGQSVVTVRRFRLGGDRDTDSSDSDDEKGGTASRWRGGASAASTARTRLVAASQQMSSPTAAAAISASLPPRAESSSSLELSTPSSSMTSSPARSALAPGLRKSIAATAAPEEAPEDKRRSSSSSGKGIDTHQASYQTGKREHGGGGAAHSSQQLQSTGSTVSALLSSTMMCSAKEGDIQVPPRGAITGDAAAALPVASVPSTTASNSPALLADAVRPRSSSTGVFFHEEDPSWTKAVEGAASATSLTSLSGGAAAGMSRTVTSITATDTMGRPALPLAAAPAQAAATSMKPAPADAALAFAAAVAPVRKSSLREAKQKSVRPSVAVVAHPSGVLEAPPAATSSSSSSDDADLAILAPLQISNPTSTGHPSGCVATATQSLTTRKLTVPLTTAAGADTPPSSSSPRLPLPSATRLSTVAAGQTATPTATSTASLPAFTAGPGGESIASGSGSPVLSGPGSLAYNRVSAQGRGSVPSSVLEAPSRPRWGALPREHTAPPSFPAMAAQPTATSAAPPPPPESVASTGASHAEVPSPAAVRANPLFASPFSVALPTRPCRQAPRLPGATHTSAGLSLIEDDGAQRQCSSSLVASTLSAERSRAEAGQPKAVGGQQRGLPSSRSASPPSTTPRAFLSSARGAASSADGASSPLLSRSAAVTAAQREREAALVIYDDRVPPAKRRAKRQAPPLTDQAAEGSHAEVVSAWLLLPGGRTTASPEGERGDVLRCRPVLHFGRVASVRRSRTDCFSEKRSLDGRDAGADDDDTVDAGDDAAGGRLAYTTDSHGSSDGITGQYRHPERSSSGDRSAKAKKRSGCNRIVQRLFSDTVQQQQRRKPGLNAFMSRTSNSESTSRVVVCVGRQAASTARDAKAAHKDVSSGAVASTEPPPTTASRIAATSLLADEAVHFDLLNYRRFCSRQ